MNDADKTTFFYILQQGLWQRSFDHLPDTQTDWESIYRMSIRQTVSGIMFDGLANLPVDLQPDKTLLRQWYARTIKIEQANLLLNSVLSEITNIYKNNGLHPILLKGQGLAQNYHNPLHRQCGDIDLYFGKENYKKANDIAFSLGIQNVIKMSKHLSFSYKNIVIENHRVIVQLHNPLYTMRLNKIINKYFPHRIQSIAINEDHVSIPDKQFNVLYVFLHLSIHYLGLGVGLRQLCDWARVLYVHNDIDRDILLEDLNNLGFLDMWVVFGYIVVNNLGLPKEFMPFYDENASYKARRILSQIMYDGNFGVYSYNPQHRLSFVRKWYTFMYILKRSLIYNSIFPKKIFLYTIFQTVDLVIDVLRYAPTKIAQWFRLK